MSRDANSDPRFVRTRSHRDNQPVGAGFHPRPSFEPATTPAESRRVRRRWKRVGLRTAAPGPVPESDLREAEEAADGLDREEQREERDDERPEAAEELVHRTVDARE